MRRTLPATLLHPGHPDMAVLGPIRADLELRAGGFGALEHAVPPLLREVIDDVIQTPRTGRRGYDELEKTEKTYIGTRVEIMLRALLNLPRGRLDTVIAGHDTDIKHTMGNTWMVPGEAVDHPCILVAADEARALCCLGLMIARPPYLTAGANRDAKRSVSSHGFAHIDWILAAHPYPANFWAGVPKEAVERIFAGDSGNARVLALFRELQGVPVPRGIVESVARQKDFMRRLRADHGKGTRDRLAEEGILLLSAVYDGQLIKALGLPAADFVSHRPRGEADRRLARAAGWNI